MKLFIFYPICEIYIFQHNVCSDDLACFWIDKTWAIASKRRIWRRRPPENVITNITRIPRRIIWLYFYLDRIMETGLLKRLIPRQYPFLNCAPKFERGCVFDPPNNRFYGFRNTLIWIFLYKIPPMN